MTTTRPAAAAVATALLAALGLSACDSPEAFVGGSLLTVSILGIVALALIVYAIIDLIRRPMPLVNKVIWGVIIWVLPFIGAIVYLVFGRTSKPLV